MISHSQKIWALCSQNHISPQKTSRCRAICVVGFSLQLFVITMKIQLIVKFLGSKENKMYQETFKLRTFSVSQSMKMKPAAFVIVASDYCQAKPNCIHTYFCWGQCVTFIFTKINHVTFLLPIQTLTEYQLRKLSLIKHETGSDKKYWSRLAAGT